MTTPNSQKKAVPQFPEPWAYVPIDKNINTSNFSKATGKTDHLITRWIGARNKSTGEIYWIELGKRSDYASYTVLALIRPVIPGISVTRTAIGDIPLASISNIISNYERYNNNTMFHYLMDLYENGHRIAFIGAKQEAERININARSGALPDNFNDPLSPLTKVNVKDEKFLQAVAWQYIYVKSHFHETSPVDQMRIINHKAASTIQRWLTYARKRGVLPSALRGGR